MKRLALMLIVLLLPLVFVAFGTPGAADDRAEIRIPHLDGSGTETIVDVHPSIPGIGAFVRSTPDAIPQPGEVILPPGPSATPSAPMPPPPPEY
ncbi:MAG: hypothetical protein ABIR79_09205 [Candidatus Binatia bacterium]